MRARWSVAVVGTGAILGGVILAAACSRIEPGRVGILVSPSEQGSQQLTVARGLVWHLPVLTTLYEFPTGTQTVAWEGPRALSFNSREGAVFTGAVSLSYSLQERHIPAFYLKFRSDDLHRYESGYLRTAVAAALGDAAAGLTAEEAYGSRRDEILRKAKARVQEEVAAAGVVIEQLAFLGVPTPPDTIRSAIESKILAVHGAGRAEQEMRLAKAEVERQVSVSEAVARAKVAQARAEAEANRVLNASLTPKLLEWEKMKAPRNCGPKELADRLEPQQKFRITLVPAL